MSVVLTPKQQEIQEILRGPQRHTLIYGGARSGKTFLFVRALMTRAVMAPGSRHAILRLRANAARASIALDTLPKVIRLCFPGLVLTEHRLDGFWEMPNGSQVWIGGLDDKDRVEKILGQEYATIFLNECSQIPYASVLIARTRLAQVVEFVNPETKVRQILPQRLYYDLNPTGSKHWSNQEFGLHRNPLTGEPLKNSENYVRLNLNPVDNQQNLTADTLLELESLPSRQRKRFYEGVYLNEIDGALWTPDVIDRSRCDRSEVPDLKRKVVAVDPSGARGDEVGALGKAGRSNNIGIIVVGLGVDNKGYVLEDLTCCKAPAAWGRDVVAAYHRHQADCIVAENNFGGAMVEHVIRTEDPNVSYKEVSASRGKWIRAEPISALYEQDKVRHVGRFHELEEEMGNFSTSGYLGEKSPDRADALVWGLTEIMLGSSTTGFLDLMRTDYETMQAARHRSAMAY